MTSSIYNSTTLTMSSLDNLFIEMTAKNCNQHCKHCYIDFPKYKKEIDYIPPDTIKQALNDTTKDNLKYIYLTGAEPMMHPDFNAILRLCLKRCNVCICTNGSFINEKKARFLKKVEDETENEIVFKISIDHYNEIKNDDVRYRGAYRHAIFAVKHLVKYNFNTILIVTNIYNLPENELLLGFEDVIADNNLPLDRSNIQINPWYDKNASWDEIEDFKNQNPDCKTGRILTTNGIYCCPFLSNDYRGWCGINLTNYNKKTALETNYCATCAKHNGQIFSINNNIFEY